MSKMQIFENPEFGRVRGGMGQDGKPWFIGIDIAEALGYSNTTKAIRTHVDEEDKKYVMSNFRAKAQNGLVPKGQTKTLLINESGVYSLILRSKLDSAKKFKRWVTSEVLPSISKHGMYMTPQTFEQAIHDPDYLLKIFTAYKEERDKRIEAEEQNKLLTADNEHKDSVINGLTEDIPLAEKRQRIIQIIRHHVSPSQIATRWGLLYSEFNKKYHCNVKLRFERQREEFDPKLKNPLDYIERGMDMIPELYELACKLFESDIDSLLEEWSTTISREDFIY